MRTDWRIVNDDVMGGVSTARVAPLPDGARFEGVVRLEFNGGFASMRRDASVPAQAIGLQVEARGDGNRYRLTVYVREPRSGQQAPLSYHAVFATAPGATTVERLLWPQFRASFRGRAVPAAPPLVAADVLGLGIMITKAEHAAGAGSFALELVDITPVLPSS
jgi:monofunctional biosynthetic peptidoglycan transglycosylase